MLSCPDLPKPRMNLWNSFSTLAAASIPTPTYWTPTKRTIESITSKSSCAFYFYFYFPKRGEHLPGFTSAWFSHFWCFVAGPVVKLRLRRPRKLGYRAFRTAASPEESAGRPPQLLCKGNIEIIRNRIEPLLLCACSAVLIYLDIRFFFVFFFFF
jgi:hypothetical protein